MFAILDRVRALELQLSEVKDLSLSNSALIDNNRSNITMFQKTSEENKAMNEHVKTQVQNMKTIIESVRPAYSSVVAGTTQSDQVNNATTLTKRDNENVTIISDDNTNVKLIPPLPSDDNTNVMHIPALPNVNRTKPNDGMNRANKSQNLPSKMASKPRSLLSGFHRDKFGSVSSLANSVMSGWNFAPSEQDFQYQSQYQKRLKRQKIVTGKATTGRIRGAPPPSRDIFVYRLNSDTVDDDMLAYLHDNSVDVRDLICMSHEDSKFKSYKVTVSVTDMNRVFNEDFWPSGVRVRKFKQPQRQFNS